MKRIIKDPLFIMNFKLYPDAHIINVFEKCFQVFIPKLGKNGWFKLEHLVPIEYCKNHIFDIRGFYINKEELYKKKMLPMYILEGVRKIKEENWL